MNDKTPQQCADDFCSIVVSIHLPQQNGYTVGIPISDKLLALPRHELMALAWEAVKIQLERLAQTEQRIAS